MSGKYDAFRQGVQPGGMLNTSDIRLLICYSLRGLAEPVSKKVITDALAGSGLANFFEVGSAVDDLVDLKLLYKTGEGAGEKYSITDTGKDISYTMETDLPKSVREKALKQVTYFAAMERRMSENEILVEKSDTGYSVTFQVGKGKDAIMRLTLFTAGAEQVEMLKKGFLNSPENLCECVLHALLDEHEG